MQRALGWGAVVVVLCWAPRAVAEERRADPRLAEAQAALEAGKKLKDAGKYAEALPQLERALALNEAALGRAHLDVARCLLSLGDLHRIQGTYAQAEPLLQRALEINEAALGKDHPDVATALHALGILNWAQGLYARAEPLYRRALSIREASLGKDHPDVASSLNNLAILYWNEGLYDQAEPLLQRALEIKEATLGKDHPSVAKSLLNLGLLHQAQGLPARAEPLCQRALAIQEKALGKDHPDVAMSLNNLAITYFDQGLYRRAEPIYQRALAIREAALGKDHPEVAASLNNLANLYRLQGLYARAEPLLKRAIEIKEAALGKDHPDIAASLNNLAVLYEAQGAYDRAEPLDSRALAIQEKALGKDHPDVALSLRNLAILHQSQGHYRRAEPLYRRALGIHEAALGKEHPEVATDLNGLADLYRAQGLYAQAEPLYRRALAIRESSEDKTLLGATLNSLAELYRAKGLHARAERLYRRALEIRESLFDKDHHHVAEVLNNLAQLRLAQGRLADAVPLFTRAFRSSEERLRREALDLSESRLASLLQLLRSDEERLYALLRAHLEDADVRRLALAAVLLRKGRSIEETADTSRTIYRSLGPDDREAFERLRGLRTQLATLSLGGPGKLAPAVHQQRLKDLAAQGDALEADLARRSAPLRALAAQPRPAEIVDRVAAALPRDGALVELVAYTDRPLVPAPAAPGSPVASKPRYLALVLFPDGRTRALDLGPAAPIDRAAARLHDAFAGREADYQGPAQAVYALAFRPLAPLLGDARMLFLAPDGQLGLVPFAALHDGRRFLLDAFELTYLTSGKDLLPRPESGTPARSVVVLADPDFGAAPSPSPSGAPRRPERSYSVERFFSTLRADVADTPWAPLPGTREEAEAIQRLIPEAQVFLGATATKERLLGLAAPGILHIATHGFFLEDPTAPAGARAVGHFGALGSGSPGQHLPDPLLRSGLVLAGARAPAAKGGGAAMPRLDEALVTALELAGLDLWGTQLVVLSACDTGRGEVKLGQGVYGLRRALVVAGAETLVMSLWKVNDGTTRALMERYYRNLLDGKGRSAALREAMQAVREAAPHPRAWAPFIVLGKDAPLRGLER